MGKKLDSITPELASFIEAQPLFFVATAPLAQTGHINLSPKGLDTFRVLSPNRVAYLDLTGSGNETSAHLMENSRITFMFCSFGKRPLILRLYGKGQTILPTSKLWDDVITHFHHYPGIRQVIVADVEFVQTSCGFGVPVMEMTGERDRFIKWVEAKDEDELREYQRKKNSKSIDGLPTPVAGEMAASD